MARRTWIGVAVWAAFAASWPGGLRADGETAAVRQRVALIPLGRFDPSLLPAIGEGLGTVLGVEAVPLPRRPLPAAAYYPPRHRYRADRLLDHLRPLATQSSGFRTVLGLTSVDISTTKPPHRDWGIFGLGDIDGPAAVISDFRLRRGHPSPAQLRFRVVSTAVHEVGHTLGLPHCTEHRCVMQDAQGTIDTVDGSTGTLGPGCRARLARGH